MADIQSCIGKFLYTTGMDFYYHYFQMVELEQDATIPTAGVCYTSKGALMKYNPRFIASLSDRQCMFLLIHECMHLLSGHNMRSSNMNHSLANMAADFIINYGIIDSFPKGILEIPKGKDGRNMGLFMPKEYKGDMVLEEVYRWVKESMPDRPQREPRYGEYGMKSANAKYECYEWTRPEEDSQNAQSGQSDSGDETAGGMQSDLNGSGPGSAGDSAHAAPSFDVHLKDEVSPMVAQAIASDMESAAKARGAMPGSMEKILAGLKRVSKDYLSEFRRFAGKLAEGARIDDSTIMRESRRVGGFGTKGRKSEDCEVWCILDTSGSIVGEASELLSIFFSKGATVTLIQIDTEIRDISKVRSNSDLKRVKVKGGGGTTLQPAIDFLKKSKVLCIQNGVILTDGYTDTLDLAGLKGEILCLTTHSPLPTKGNKKVKCITKK